MTHKRNTDTVTCLTLMGVVSTASCWGNITSLFHPHLENFNSDRNGTGPREQNSHQTLLQLKVTVGHGSGQEGVHLLGFLEMFQGLIDLLGLFLWRTLTNTLTALSCLWSCHHPLCKWGPSPCPFFYNTATVRPNCSLRGSVWMNVWGQDDWKISECWLWVLARYEKGGGDNWKNWEHGKEMREFIILTIHSLVLLT